MDAIIAQLMKLAELEDTGRIATTHLFWDCECDDDYIHPNKEATCGECGATKDSQPDARVREVVALILKHTEVT